MAKIVRYTGNLPAFASGALGTERTIFGDVTQSDTLDANINADFQRGWGIVGVNENPTKQDFNALAFTATQLAAYIHQMGVAEWDSLQEYHEWSLCQRNGAIYISASNTNTGNDPETDDGTNWAQGSVTQINTLAKLRDQGGSAGRRIHLKARATEGDGGEGVFRWDASNLSVAVTNDPESGVYVAPTSDLTGASGAWVRVWSGPVNVQWYGAVADGVTNASTAINAALDQFWRSSLAANPLARQILIPPGDYLISSGIDLTSVRFSGTALEGRGQLIGYGATLIGNCTGKPVIDAIRSLGVEIAGLAIIGDETNTPYNGIQIGRAVSGESSDRMLLRDVTIDGKYTFASLYNLASERFHGTDCVIRNTNLAAGTYAYVLDGRNEFGATSDFYTITIPVDTPQSNLSHYWEQSTFAKASGSVNGPIYMTRFGRMTMMNCYGLAYSGYAITVMYDGSPIADSVFNFHAETAGMNGAVYFDSTGASPVRMEGFQWRDNSSHASDAVFVSPVGVDVRLTDANIYIGGYQTTPTSGLFDADSRFVVRGKIALPTTGIATLSGNLDFIGKIDTINFDDGSMVYPEGTQEIYAVNTQDRIIKGTTREYSDAPTSVIASALTTKDLVKTENGSHFYGSDSTLHTTMSWGDSTTETEEWDFQSYVSGAALRFRRNPNSSSATITSGTATGAHQLNKLVDTGADFVTAGVAIGDVVVNTTDGTLDIVTLVAATELTFANDLFPLNTEAYTIRGPLQLGLAFLTEGHNRVTRLEADPMSGTGGDFYYNTTLDQYRGYKDGTGWVTL